MPNVDPSMYPQPTGDYSVKRTVLSSTWTMFIIASAFLSLRMYCRIARTKQTWWDDYLLLLGWVFLAGSISLQTFIFNEGYLYTALGGPQITPANLASDSLMKLSLAATKTSFALTLIRLVSSKGWIVWIVVAITFLTDVMMFLHAILVWRNTCGSPSSPYTFEPCWDAYSGLWMNFVGSIISGVGDFALSFVPLAILWNLQIAKREKIGVAVAMSMGTIAGVTAIVKAVATLNVVNVTGPAFGRELMALSIYIHAEADAAIIAASIPILRTLLRDVKKLYTRGRSTGGHYVRSNQESNFHTASCVANGGPKADSTSETSILPMDKHHSGILRTDRVTVSNVAMYGYHPERDEFELEDRRPQRR